MCQQGAHQRFSAYRLSILLSISLYHPLVNRQENLDPNLVLDVVCPRCFHHRDDKVSLHVVLAGVLAGALA